MILLILALAVLWVMFCVEYPHIGLPVTGAAVVAGVLYSKRRAIQSTLQSLVSRSPKRPAGGARAAAAPTPGEGGEVARPEGDAAPRVYERTRPCLRRESATRWDLIRRQDPGFSAALFHEFVARLFLRYHEALGNGGVGALDPYLSRRMREQVRRSQVRHRIAGRSFRDLLIGSLQTLAVDLKLGRQRVDVAFEYQFEVRRRDAQPALHYGTQVWRLERAQGARTPAPEVVRALGCPGCGAPVTGDVGEACPACSQPVVPGRGSWQVTLAKQSAMLPREETPLLLGTFEHGLDALDVVHSEFEVEERRLLERDAGFAWGAFLAWALQVFQALQEAWSTDTWDRARPLQTALLHQTHRFWLETYRARGWRNHLEGVDVQLLVPVKVVVDELYEAITVRIFSSGLEYTLDAQGEVIDGSRGRRRSFSEYWTFLRRAGCTRTGSDVVCCPNCAAPVEVNQAGECVHCDAQVTQGDFGWVVSLVEQDEVYSG